MYNVCSVHRETFSTSEGIKYIMGISWVHQVDIMIHVGSKLIKALDLYWKPRWTHDILPMYWTPRGTEHPPINWTHIIQGDIHKQHCFHSTVFHFYLFTYLWIFYTLAVLDLWSVSVIHIYKKHRFHSTVVHLYWLRYLQIWHILSVLVF